MDLQENTHVKAIADILLKTGDFVEGNMICDMNPNHFTISQNLAKIHNIRSLVAGKGKLCEIGVNACHSLLIMLLVNPTAEYLLFDLGNHRYTASCLEYVRTAFPSAKIQIIYGNSVETVAAFIKENPTECGTYDFCHIDGGHTEDVFSHDFLHIKSLAAKGAPIVFDDYNLGPIQTYIHDKLAKNEITEFNANLVPTDRHFIYSYI